MALSETDARLPERVVPSRLDALVFQLKVNVFRVRRFAVEFGRAPKRLAKGDVGDFPHVIAEARSALWGDQRSGEQAMQQGKVHNLRAASRLLDRTVLDGGAVFSFWRQMGRASGRNGFTKGRMLQGGCLVPATGGGLCQLSKALYEVALDSGCRIVERHGHSRRVPGSRTTEGRDATVAWNYVDLRFASDTRVMLRVIVEREELVVRLLAPEAAKTSPAESLDSPASPGTEAGPHSCGTCDETACFRHEGGTRVVRGRTAFLVDELWPEFDAYIHAQRDAGDTLCVPLDGKRFGLARYGWNTGGFAGVASAWRQTLMRSVASRRLAEQGATRQQAQLRASQTLAAAYARALTSATTELVVAQTLLPFLWREGQLGGRRFRVLMTRLPLGVLQARLDVAAAAHPDRATLADFRAPAWLVAAETEALAAADAIVTPHAEIAALFGARAVRLDWNGPKMAKRTPSASRRIAFVGPTVARKGACELRAVALALDLEVVLLGSELEGAGFWGGVRTVRADGAGWLDGVAAVVQPALVEDKPRKLLAALAAGVPVIATKACGLPEQDGLTLVPMDDADALVQTLARLFG